MIVVGVPMGVAAIRLLGRRMTGTASPEFLAAVVGVVALLGGCVYIAIANFRAGREGSGLLAVAAMVVGVVCLVKIVRYFPRATRADEEKSGEPPA